MAEYFIGWVESITNNVEEGLNREYNYLIKFLLTVVEFG